MALHKRLLMMTGSACLLVGLSACGGDDDDTPVTPAATSSVPASASASVAGYVDYLKLLVASSADTLEPVSLTSLTPPTTEVDGPMPMN